MGTWKRINCSLGSQCQGREKKVGKDKRKGMHALENPKN
jgi:hypothetical protein